MHIFTSMNIYINEKLRSKFENGGHRRCNKEVENEAIDEA